MQTDYFGQGEGGGVLFSLFAIYVEKRKLSFHPMFLIGTCPMRKAFLRITHMLILISFPWKIAFSLKLLSGHFLGNRSLKTYAAKFHTHHSRIWKQVKLAGSSLLTIYGFESSQLSYTLMSYWCSYILLTK